jgi:hypothetical protein
MFESTVFLGIGFAYYWFDPLANSADWDYPTLGAKLTFESVRFDNNLFATNHVLHPLAGTANYGFARVNGFAPAAAFASTAVFSIVWEYTLEYREQVSVNDMLFTPFGGMAMGEFAFQLGAYLNSAPGGGKSPQRIARATLGLPQLVHDSMDGLEAPRTPPLDSLGFSSAFAHRFRLAYQETLVTDETRRLGSLHGFNVEATLVAMPGFLRPGRFSQTFSDGNFVEMRSRAGWGPEGMNDVNLDFRAALLGNYAQEISGRIGGQPVGRAALLALTSGFVFNQREILDRRDRYAIVHLFGPNAVGWVGSGGVLGMLDLGIFADFAGIHPVALSEWQAVNGRGEEKSILVRQSYAYTWGFSSRLRARLSVGSVELEGTLGYGEYDSVQGIDRLQEDVLRDVPLRDTMFDYGAHFELAPPSTPISLRVAASALRRTGRMGEAYETSYEQRLDLSAGLRF